MKEIKVKNVTKKFGDLVVLDNIDFTVRGGEFLTLLGPSGCGKTTMLRIIAGLLRPNQGKIFFGNEEVTLVPPNRRKVGLVFQNYALFPHMNVFGNVAFGLRMKKIPMKQIRKKVEEVLQLLDMEGLESRKPGELSGGQQQRVATARALVYDPDVFLLDEPLSNLDAKLRIRVRLDLRNLQQKTRKTTIFVTHDQTEALTMSDRVALINKGRIEQIGSPEDLYMRPATRYAANFIGTNNFFKGRIKKIDGEMATFAIAEDLELRGVFLSKNAQPGMKAYACIRPESIDVINERKISEYLNVIEAKIEEVVFQGSLIVVYARFQNQLIEIELQRNPNMQFSKGETVLLGFNECSILV